MTIPKIVNHSEKTKKIRRRIEEKLRLEIPEKKIKALAIILDINVEDNDQGGDQQ
jgi:hypothetical protein